MDGQTPQPAPVRPRPRRHHEPSVAPASNKRPFVVASLPHVSGGHPLVADAGRYRIDPAVSHVPATPPPPPPVVDRIDATPLTRDWYRVVSGLAVSVLLLYFAWQSLFVPRRVHVDSEVVGNEGHLRDLASDKQAPAVDDDQQVAHTGIAALRQNGLPTAERAAHPGAMLTDSDVIARPGGSRAGTGATSPTFRSAGSAIQALPPAADRSLMSASTPFDLDAGLYPGTGFPSITMPSNQVALRADATRAATDTGRAAASPPASPWLAQRVKQPFSAAPQPSPPSSIEAALPPPPASTEAIEIHSALARLRGTIEKYTE